MYIHLVGDKNYIGLGGERNVDVDLGARERLKYIRDIRSNCL